jgi:hypothetical protein
VASIAAAPPIGGSARRVPMLAGAAVLFGLVAGQLIASGRGGAVVGLGAVLVPVALWKRPYLTPAVLLFTALLIEQFPDNMGVGSVNLTARVPLFHGLGSLRLSPADLLLGGLFLLALLKARGEGALQRLKAPVAYAIAGLLGAVLLGVVIGLAHGGEVRVAFMECRPYAYLAATYVLGTLFLTDRRAVRAVLWAIVGAAGLKAVQALYIFASIRGMVPRPEAVLGHEEALFFGVFVVLCGALWLYGIEGRLRTTATALLPVVMMADLVNSRRAAWLVLGGGLIVLAIVAVRSLPSRRLLVMRLGAVILVILSVYLPAFWNKSGGLAQPARAVRSTVAPSARDASSDLYRMQEDANLKVNIAQAGVLGKGFGVRIDYPLPIADIRDIDPLIDYVPHNGVLYVLMRMGVLGGVALWTLIGVGILVGGRLARSADREHALVGAVLVCAMVGYALEGAVDQGFFFYRIAFVMGTLLALGEAASRLQRRTGSAAR